MVRTILFSAIFICNILISGNVSDFFGPGFDVSKLKVVDCITTPKSFISFVTDNKKQILIIKQDRSPSCSAQFKVIREMLASYLASVNNIKAHNTTILPGKFEFPGKVYKERPATVHKVVPGYPMYKLCNWPSKALQQECKSHHSKRQDGLQDTIIYYMSLHPDLPAIIALDTFIGNVDRSITNLFYDDQKDRFFAIDMEKSFKKNLCEIACAIIKNKLCNNEAMITLQELYGLTIYRNTLQGLIEHNSIRHLHVLLEKFTRQAKLTGFSQQNNRQPGRVRKLASKLTQYIQMYKRTIWASYKSAEKLVILLDQFIKQQTLKIHEKLFLHYHDDPITLTSEFGGNQMGTSHTICPTC